VSDQKLPRKHEFGLRDGAVVSYVDVGSGPVVLLVHGVCVSSVFFGNNIDVLADTHRVIAVDLRSHGDSPIAGAGNTVVDGIFCAVGLSRAVRHRPV
jgi:non-heme chloroperoxidase